MADLFRQSIGMKNLKYCAAVGGFAALRMRHAPCGYTKYSCVFHTSTCQKISRRPLLLIESELPDTLLFRGAAWDKCKMESGKFPAARCRGGDSRARHCTSKSYRLTIKMYKPIASVAAVSDRPVGTDNRYTVSLKWGMPPNCHCEEAEGRRGNLLQPVAFSPRHSCYSPLYCEIPTSLRSSE